MSDTLDSIVIVGAGQAGGWCAKSLRKEGFSGTITLIGDENHLPYERPPLSKSVLSGADEPDICLLYSDSAIKELQLNFLANDPVVAINRPEQSIRLQSGNSVAYDRLVLATGGRARTLSGLQGDRVHVIRTIEDSLRLKEALVSGNSLLVLGGGWIGLEVAATAASHNVAVTVVEAQHRLCARAVPPILSDYLLDLHRRHGIRIHLDAQADEWIIDSEKVKVILANGQSLEADHLLVGIGLAPETRLGEEAGLRIDNGIAVDGDWRTSDEKIFAIGDTANRYDESRKSSLRLESWANAMHSAESVAKIILNHDSGLEVIPWFWSDQFDVKIQMIGVPTSWTTPILRGNPQEDSRAIFFEENGFLSASITINQPRVMQIAKRLMARRKSVTRSQLADENENLKALLR